VVIEGQTLDLGPILADLLRRDARWLSTERLRGIDDLSVVALRAPGGKRLEAPASTLKPIVAALLDLLSDPRQAAGPWRRQ
uniref:hypothetical protein n=1 Tax=Rosenbergiella australiborealis TaxID=1544696 RepID=UPI001F4D8274